MRAFTLPSFGGLDLRVDPEEAGGSPDLLNVELDRPGRVRARDGYLKLTSSAGATRYDSVFSVATAGAVSSVSAIAGTGADDSAVGSSSWTNPGNITADDGTYATINLSGGSPSHYLKATNFGFAVPGTATILGIAVDVERSTTAPAGRHPFDNSVRLYKAGVLTGDDLASPDFWPSTDTVATYGNSSELWGAAWTAADVNGATFGVGVSAAGTTSGRVDYIRVTVYYLTPSNVAVAGAASSRLDVLDSTGAVVATVATASDAQSSYVAFGSPSTSAVYIANSGTTIRKLVGTTFSTPAGMPKCKFVGLQTPDNRLVAANVNQIPTGAASTASTSLVHFSDAGSPEVWGANNYVYLTPGDNEDIQGVCTWRNNVYVFKSSRLFRFYGNSTDSTGNPVFNYREQAGAGLAAPLGIAVAPEGIYFLDRRGIYFTTGGPAQRVSRMIDPLFQGGASSVYSSGVINPSALAQVSMAYLNDRLYVGVPLGSATTNDHTLVFDPATQQWTLWDVPMGAMSVTASQPARLLFTYAQGTFDIGQYAQNAYTDDAGTAISSRYRTGFMDLGTPDAEKIVSDLIFDGTDSITVKTANNDSATLGTGATVTLGTSPAVGSGRDQRATFGRNLSFEMSGSAAWSVSRVTANVLGERDTGAKSP